jgi:hypothetical protein
MSALKQQLQAARREYHAARYPGDLADLLPPAPAQARWRRWAISRGGVGAALATAAAVAILLGGFAVLTSGTGENWRALLPTARDLPHMPRQSEMASAMKTITPPEVPDLLRDARRPLVSSGKFILGIGKDVAHHADALFHMG